MVFADGLGALVDFGAVAGGGDAGVFEEADGGDAGGVEVGGVEGFVDGSVVEEDAADVDVEFDFEVGGEAAGDDGHLDGLDAVGMGLLDMDAGFGEGGDLESAYGGGGEDGAVIGEAGPEVAVVGGVGFEGVAALLGVSGELLDGGGVLVELEMELGWEVGEGPGSGLVGDGEGVVGESGLEDVDGEGAGGGLPGLGVGGIELVGAALVEAVDDLAGGGAVVEGGLPVGDAGGGGGAGGVGSGDEAEGVSGAYRHGAGLGEEVGGGPAGLDLSAEGVVFVFDLDGLGCGRGEGAVYEPLLVGPGLDGEAIDFGEGGMGGVADEAEGGGGAVDLGGGGAVVGGDASVDPVGAAVSVGVGAAALEELELGDAYLAVEVGVFDLEGDLVGAGFEPGEEEAGGGGLEPLGLVEEASDGDVVDFDLEGEDGVVGGVDDEAGFDDEVEEAGLWEGGGPFELASYAVGIAALAIIDPLAVEDGEGAGLLLGLGDGASELGLLGVGEELGLFAEVGDAVAVAVFDLMLVVGYQIGIGGQG